MELTIRAPHLSGRAQGCRHGRINDDIAGHVQVGDPAVRIYHRHIRPCAVNRLQVRFNGCPLLSVKRLNFGIDIANAIVGVHTKLSKLLAVFFKDVSIVNLHGMAKDYRVRNLHHRGFQVQGHQHTLILRILNLRFEKLAQVLHAHAGSIDNLTGLQSDIVLKH